VLRHVCKSEKYIRVEILLNLHMNIIFADAHCHFNPIYGLGAREIARRFKRVNGWFIAFIGLSPHHYGMDLTLDNYFRAHEIAIKECKRAREEGLEIACFVGLHPADIDKLVNVKKLKLEEVLNFLDKVIDHVVKLFKEGEVNGIAEIGRQHYKTEPQFLVLANLILDKVLELVKDYNMITHLHLEQAGYITILDIIKRVSRLGVPREKILIHHARPGTLEHAISSDLIASTPGIEPVLRIAMNFEPKYLIESDFIDDPKRPGIVVEPWKMIEYELKIMREKNLNEDYLWKVNVDNIVKFYNVNVP